MKQINYTKLESAIIMALAAEREADLAAASSANPYRGTNAQRADALWAKTQIKIWEKEVDRLISAAATGRREVEVDDLVNRLLFRYDKGRRTLKDVQFWVQKEVVPFWMK